ncbi:MAG: 50S ribosomal protein L30 [Synergistaceae bacterium]|jgi:large subunit ribosomal protein L30|nr:50S ribosomal protein L30 [Synergistaceae bacterium]
MANIRIKWVKSAIGFPARQKRTLEALGFKKLQSVVEHEDTPQIRGMIEKVRHLVKDISDDQGGVDR